MSLEESIKLAVESLDAQLYDIVTTKENDRNIYRVYVTAKGGITLDKCAEISRIRGRCSIHQFRSKRGSP